MRFPSKCYQNPGGIQMWSTPQFFSLIFLFMPCQRLTVSRKHYFTLDEFVLNLLCWGCLTVLYSSSSLSEILASLQLLIFCSNHCDFSSSFFSYSVYSWLNKFYESQNHNRSDLKTCWTSTLHAPVVYEYNAFVSSIFLCRGSTAWWLCITQWSCLTLVSLSITRKLVKGFFFSVCIFLLH